MTWSLPTIAGIQRATIIFASVLSLILAVAVSYAAAISALLGAAVMIANLYLLAILGRFLLAVGQHGGSATLGAALAPLKMVLIIGAVYVIISSGRVNLPGFSLGLLTQLVAVFIETWRVSAWPDLARAATSGGQIQP
jgi:hypothetical protein